MIAVTRRSWLVVVAVLVVAIGVVVGVVVASSGSGGNTPAAKGGTPTSTASTSAAPLPSLCPSLTDSLVAKQLHVSSAHGVTTSTRFARACQWRNSAGDRLLSVTTDTQPYTLLLHTLGNNGAVKVRHLAGTAVFAPRPPRLALNVRGTGVAIVLAPAGYRSILPAGTTDPARISRSTVLAPLIAFAKPVARYLTR